MKRGWSFIRKLTAGLAILCWYMAMSISDYHLLELREPEPQSVNHWIVVGFVLLIPTAIHLIAEAIKAAKRD